MNTVDNLADFFTKPLDAKDFFRIRDIMNVPKYSAYMGRMRRLRAMVTGGDSFQLWGGFDHRRHAIDDASCMRGG